MLDHFKISEFDSPDKPGSGRFMDSDFLMNLDKAREIANTCFIITLGFMTPEYNKKVGGSETSSHLKGLAVKIECNNSPERYLIMCSLIQLGFARIGIAENFLHLDADGSKPDAIWLIKKRNKHDYASCTHCTR